MAHWSRYVAVGDSFTEGLEDPGTNGRHRGWADRVAETLAERSPQLQYANLAIRGRLVDPILNDQLPRAVAMKPDLLSIAGGVNDVLRPKWDLEKMMDSWESGLELARSIDATVVIVTFGQPANRSRVLGAVQARLQEYRERLLATARRHDCLVVDFWYAPVFDDPRFWAPDRLHLNSLGHERVSYAVLNALGEPTPDWLAPLPSEAPAAAHARLRSDAAWIGGHLAPWIGRRLVGRSSGDGVTPKRPKLRVVTPGSPL